jgi:DNA-binding transcriptional ArsR family regulator
VKRDMELIRSILFAVEEAKPDADLSNLKYDGYSEAQVTEHIGLLVEAGYIEAYSWEGDGRKTYLPKRLTWAGHDFLDAARSDTVWQKAKARIATIGGTVSLDVLKEVLVNVAKGQLGLP